MTRLLVAEALIQLAGDTRKASVREERAWELAEEILAGDGLSAQEFIRQIDNGWDGPR